MAAGGLNVRFGKAVYRSFTVDQIAERGRELGILVEPPTDVGGSVGYFTMLRDPDGRLVEFTHGQPIEGLH